MSACALQDGICVQKSPFFETPAQPCQVFLQTFSRPQGRRLRSAARLRHIECPAAVKHFVEEETVIGLGVVAPGTVYDALIEDEAIAELVAWVLAGFGENESERFSARSDSIWPVISFPSV